MPITLTHHTAGYPIIAVDNDSAASRLTIIRAMYGCSGQYLSTSAFSELCIMETGHEASDIPFMTASRCCIITGESSSDLLGHNPSLTL